MEKDIHVRFTDSKLAYLYKNGKLVYPRKVNMYNQIIECLLVILVLDAIGLNFRTWQWFAVAVPMLFVLVYLRKKGL